MQVPQPSKLKSPPPSRVPAAMPSNPESGAGMYSISSSARRAAPPCSTRFAKKSPINLSAALVASIRQLAGGAWHSKLAEPFIRSSSVYVVVRLQHKCKCKHKKARLNNHIINTHARGPRHHITLSPHLVLDPHKRSNQLSTAFLIPTLHRTVLPATPNPSHLTSLLTEPPPASDSEPFPTPAVDITSPTQLRLGKAVHDRGQPDRASEPRALGTGDRGR